MLEGSHLYLHLIEEDTILATTFTKQPLDDEAWYSCTIQFGSELVTITVIGDGDICSSPCTMSASIPAGIDYFIPPFNGTLVFGDYASFLQLSPSLLNQLTTESGVEGCVRNLVLSEDGPIQSLDVGFSDTYPSQAGCPREAVCSPNPCDNGECLSSWSGYTCQCVSDFTGTNCTEGMYVCTHVHYFIMLII